MRLLWLPEVLRSAGLDVREYPGWRTRGADDWGPVTGLVCHATAGSRAGTDDGELRTIAVTGSTSAPAPIAQLYLSRSGTWWVVASGRCNHVRYSDVRPGSPLGRVGNSGLIGVEAANDNRGEPWPTAQVDAYQRGVAAICRHMRWPPWRAQAHWEHQAGKTDPHGIDMTAFRARVTALLAGREDDDMDAEQDRKLDNLDALNSALLIDADVVRGVRHADGTVHEYPLPLAVRVRAAADSVAALAAQVSRHTEQLDEISAALAALAARDPDPTTPADPAALKAVLLDPDVLTAVARAVADEDHRRSAE